VAVTVTRLVEGGVEGAVYTPLTSIEPKFTPFVVGSDQVTARQVLPTMDASHPGLLTLATRGNVSPVPTIAELGMIAMLIPEIIVIVAVCVLVVSACAVAVIVATGAGVVVPLLVTVGTVLGAV
jgi:hypothetical protein